MHHLTYCDDFVDERIRAIECGSSGTKKTLLSAFFVLSDRYHFIWNNNACIIYYFSMVVCVF